MFCFTSEKNNPPACQTGPSAHSTFSTRISTFASAASRASSAGSSRWIVPSTPLALRAGMGGFRLLFSCGPMGAGGRSCIAAGLAHPAAINANGTAINARSVACMWTDYGGAGRGARNADVLSALGISLPSCQNAPSSGIIRGSIAVQLQRQRVEAMSDTAVREILERIDKLPASDRMVLERRLAERAEAQWRREFDAARERAIELWSAVGVSSLAGSWVQCLPSDPQAAPRLLARRAIRRSCRREGC